MRDHPPTHKAFSSTIDYHALYSALFWLVCFIVLVVSEDGFWLTFLAFALLLLTVPDIWTEQITYKNGSLFIRKWNFKWKRFMLKDMSWAFFDDDGDTGLSFGSEICVIPSENRFQPLAQIIKTYARFYVPHLGYQMKHRDEIEAYEICGCAKCIRRFKPTELRDWRDEKQSVKLFRKRIVKFPLCPFCRSGEVFFATDKDVAMTQAGLKKMAEWIEDNISEGDRKRHNRLSRHSHSA